MTLKKSETGKFWVATFEREAAKPFSIEHFSKERLQKLCDLWVSGANQGDVAERAKEWGMI